MIAFLRMNFESFPTPPSPEKSPEDAKAVRERLAGHLETFRAKYATFFSMFMMMQGGYNLGAAIEKAQSHEAARAAEAAKASAARPSVEDQPTLEAEPSTETVINFTELQELDPEATQERLRVIIDTFPKSYIQGEVASIGFTDKKWEMDPRYGAELQQHSEGAATAGGGTRTERTVITFWKGAKTQNSEDDWNNTLIHEIAHANDWDNDLQMTDAQRVDLKARVMARVQAEDRFISGYVEKITNDDPAQRLETRAKEYWAEINQAYLGGKPLPAADAELVKAFIAAQDPSFDRDTELGRREAVIKGMAAEKESKKYLESYQTLPEEERASIDAWMEWRKGLEGAPADPETQRQGRQELVDLYHRVGKTKEGKWYMIMLGQTYRSRQELFESRQKGGPDGWNLQHVADEYEALQKAAEDFGPGAELVRKEYEDITLKQGITIGGADTRMTLLPGEYAALFSDTREEAWVPYNLGWQKPSYEQSGWDDTLEAYLARKVFMTPEH